MQVVFTNAGCYALCESDSASLSKHVTICITEQNRFRTGLQPIMGSNTLEDLPLVALDKVLCLLEPPALLQLHAATGAGMPAITQQVKAMRVVHFCAHHWLHLSKRAATLSQKARWSRRCRNAHPRGQVQQQVNPCTKHDLVEVLRSQISHINDVAAFLYHWIPCRNLAWSYQMCYPSGAGDDIEREHWERMYSLYKKIHEALSLGHQGYLDFHNKKKDPRNKIKEFSAFNCRSAQYLLEFDDQLLFLCTLHRLQQLSPEAVLARLHSIFTRCCRFDLMLASRVLCLDDTNSATQAEYQASKQEAPAADILTAFAQNGPCIRHLVSRLTVLQREEMKSCVQTMVNNHLVRVQADRHSRAGNHVGTC